MTGGEKRGRSEQVSRHGGPLACEEVAPEERIEKRKYRDGELV